MENEVESSWLSLSSFIPHVKVNDPPIRSVSSYEEEAEQGEKYAQYRMGVIYQEGVGVHKDAEKGVPKDIEKAFFWFEKAAKQGDEDALISLRKIKKAALNEE